MNFKKGEGFEKEVEVYGDRIIIKRLYSQGWRTFSIHTYHMFSDSKKYFRIRRIVEYYNVYLVNARYYIPKNSGG